MPRSNYDLVASNVTAWPVAGEAGLNVNDALRSKRGHHGVAAELSRTRSRWHRWPSRPSRIVCPTSVTPERIAARGLQPLIVHTAAS